MPERPEVRTSRAVSGFVFGLLAGLPLGAAVMRLTAARQRSPDDVDPGEASIEIKPRAVAAAPENDEATVALTVRIQGTLDRARARIQGQRQRDGNGREGAGQ